MAMSTVRQTLIGTSFIRMGAAFATTVLTILAQAAATGAAPFA